MVEMAKANGVNVYHYLTYLLEKMPNDSMSDEELELLAPWNENVKADNSLQITPTCTSKISAMLGTQEKEHP
jgi:hypothetical protein